MTGLVHCGMTVPSGHPDVLPVRIPVFAKNGDRRQEPVSPGFSRPFFPSRHAGPDPASTILRKSEKSEILGSITMRNT
jgi:hypothetical protein